MTFAHTHIVVFARGCHFTLLYSPFLLIVPFPPLLLCYIHDKHLRITMYATFLFPSHQRLLFPILPPPSIHST